MRLAFSITTLSPEILSNHSKDILQIASDVPNEYWGLEHFLKPLRGKWDLSFAIFCDGVPKAYVIASDQEGNYHIHHFMVARELRGEGIGSFMLKEAEYRTRKARLNSITLKVLETNAAARDFYLNHGFRVRYTMLSDNLPYLLLEKLLVGNTVVAIHQPNYVPWLGYLYKLALSDVFVFLDDVQFSKNGFTNRNRIKTVDGVKWLTIPVHARLKWSIRETTWSDNTWPQKHIKSLSAAYARSMFYHEVMDWFSGKVLSHSFDNLADFNIFIILSLAERLELACSFRRSSDLGINSFSDQRLIEIVQKLDGTTYLSGHGGTRYQDVLNFESAGIKLAYYDFVPPRYPQLWGDFVPGLSVLDTLFNCGFDGTRSIIDSLVSKKGMSFA